MVSPADSKVKGIVIGIDHLPGLTDLATRNLKSDGIEVGQGQGIEIVTGDGRKGSCSKLREALTEIPLRNAKDIYLEVNDSRMFHVRNRLITRYVYSSVRRDTCWRCSSITASTSHRPSEDRLDSIGRVRAC